jgi:hypothetical protein
MAISYRIDRALNQLSYSQIPLSTIMRWTVVIGVFLRIGSHIKSLDTNLYLWLFLLAIYFLYTVVISIIIIRNPQINHDKRIFFVQLFIDAFFCSIFFILTGNPESDLYLNLLLPLLVILEHVNTAHVVLFYYFAWSLLLFVILMVMVAFCKTGCTYQEIIFNTFLSRITLFLFIILFIITRNNLIRTRGG